MKRFRKLSVFLLIFILSMQQLTVHAMTKEELDEILQQLEEEQEENNKKQEELENEKQDAQSTVDDLQGEANRLGDTYYSLNNDLMSVANEIYATESAINAAETDIQALQEELEKAQAARDAQYEGMKKRIQYMYEMGTDSLLVSILNSGSIAEFMKRVEYASMIANYDRQKLQAYDDLEKTIVAKAEALEQKQTELSAYQDNLSKKKGELDELVDNAGSAYAAKQGEVDVAQMSVDEFNAMLDEIEASNTAIAEQVAAAQAAYAAQIADQTPEDTTGSLEGYTQEDLTLMAAIIQAEAGGEGYVGQLAVGTVIMNRVKSSSFPNTLSGVIYQTNQFEPVRNGALAAVLARGPDASCMQAAQEVLGGYRSGDWLFFMTQYWADHFGITGYVMIGHHAFFTRWGAN